MYAWNAHRNLSCEKTVGNESHALRIVAAIMVQNMALRVSHARIV